MTRARDRRRYPTLTDEQFRELFRAENLPPQPWRYTLTPRLVLNLTRVADAAGQMRASPLSYYRQKELAARAKRMRILWNVSRLHANVTHEEIEAVLKGARLVDRRRSTGEAIARACEEVLLSSGLVDEAYRRYGLEANQAGTYLATFRAVAKKYPHRTTSESLADLVKTTPGDEGKWFAAAKDAGLYDDALALASRTPCDPKTLARAARDFGEKEPAFAIGAGLLSLHWLVQGYGYEITGADVWGAYRATLAAAERHGSNAEVKERIRKLVAAEQAGGFVTKVLGRERGL